MRTASTASQGLIRQSSITAAVPNATESVERILPTVTIQNTVRTRMPNSLPRMVVFVAPEPCKGMYMKIRRPRCDNCSIQGFFLRILFAPSINLRMRSPTNGIFSRRSKFSAMRIELIISIRMMPKQMIQMGYPKPRAIGIMDSFPNGGIR